MLEEFQKKREILCADTLFVQREDVGGAISLQQKIGILDTFGDALEASGRSDVVLGEHDSKVVERDVRIDGHGGLKSECCASGGC